MPQPLVPEARVVLFYLVQGFEEQDVLAGVLEPAALLISFGIHHSGLGVLVLVLVGVVRLRAHCSGTRDELRHPAVDGTARCSSLLTGNSAVGFAGGGLCRGTCGDASGARS